MIYNYLKTAFRNLRRNKGFSFINLFGLSIGIACCLLIGLYVANELIFDRYHTNSHRIWRVSREFKNADGSMQLHLGHLAPPFAPLLLNDFPDIEKAVRLFEYTATFRHGDQLYIEDNFFLAEPSLFDIFDIPMIAGDPGTALNDPYTLLLSTGTVEKYFGNHYDPTEVVGRTMRFDDRADFKITGIYEGFPRQSHMHPDVLASFSTLRDSSVYGEEQLRTNFSNNAFSTYILLPENYPVDKLEAQLPDFIDKHMGSQNPSPDANKPSSWTSLHLMPLTDIHLYSDLDTEIEPNGDIDRVWIFGIVAILVLLIACINYMNLSTARALTRMKEIGVRKTLGASRQELIWQFLSESILLSFAATLFALVIVIAALPFVNQVFGEELVVHRKWLALLSVVVPGFALFTGLVAGLYPSFVLSALAPWHSFKHGSGARSSVLLRKSLVVGQFIISVVLIIAVLVVHDQLRFMRNKSLGLSRDHVVALNCYESLAPQYEAFRNTLTSSPLIRNVTRSTRLPSGRLLDSYGSATVQLESDSMTQSNVNLKFVHIDDRFIPTYDLKLAAGRNYRENSKPDISEGFILNEAAIRQIGWKSAESAIGSKLDYGGRSGRLIGVLKDFNFESLHQDILPMIVFIPTDSSFYYYLSIKLDGNNIDQALVHLESTWQQFMPNHPFDYHFLDEDYAMLYEAEQRQGRIFIGFTIIAIIIACLGLLGLATFIAQSRIKEIGVRKVLGASSAGIVTLLSRDFLWLVIIALCIASPIAWLLMHKWLNNFAYRIDISWGIFCLAGGIAISIAFLTVSTQSLKTALTNPVDSLRSE